MGGCNRRESVDVHPARGSGDRRPLQGVVTNCDESVSLLSVQREARKVQWQLERVSGESDPESRGYVNYGRAGVRAGDF